VLDKDLESDSVLVEEDLETDRPISSEDAEDSVDVVSLGHLVEEEEAGEEEVVRADRKRQRPLPRNWMPSSMLTLIKFNVFQSNLSSLDGQSLFSSHFVTFEPLIVCLNQFSLSYYNSL
jgi:hypothetical protein